MLFHNKKGLELPITAIIVLIIAITFLGLMIYFIKTSLTRGITGVETQFNLLSQQEKEFVEQLGKVVTFTLGTDWKVKKGTAKEFKVYLKNNFQNSAGTAVCHALRVKCLQAMGKDNTCPDQQGATPVIIGGYTELMSADTAAVSSAKWFPIIVSKKVDIPNSEYVSFPGTIQITTGAADTYTMEAELLVSTQKKDCVNTGDTDFESAGTERFTIEVS